MGDQNTLVYDGCNFLRQRFVLATLSGKNVKIRKIRSKDNDPGLKDFEASFVRLMDKVTNGSNIEINETGTAILYQPGMLAGGTVEHDCHNSRAIGYYLEALLCLAPFCKVPLKAILNGVTNDQVDPSVDIIKYSSLPVLKRFLGSDEGLELKQVKRGAAPEGGGQVIFTCPCKQKLRPIQYTDPGKIKRIRGICWTTRVSPAMCNRMVEAARGILNQMLPDIYIYTDHCKGAQSGRSPGFGMTLVAETINGTFLSAEACSNPKGSSKGPSVPEDLGKLVAQLLLEEVYRGGCADSSSQSLAMLMMALGDQDVCKLKVGQLSPYTIQLLRHMRDFLHIMFKMDMEKRNEDEELKLGGDKVIMTCVGVGYRNFGKVTL